MAARGTDIAEVLNAIRISNTLQEAGNWTLANQSIALQSGDVVRTLSELRKLVINMIDGIPVYLVDVAEIVDGPADARHYTWIDFGLADERATSHPANLPMVAISVAKQAGSNAVMVAHEVHAVLDAYRETLLPADIQVEVLRDYGQTANEKVNNLTSSLVIAVATVVIFIAVFLGWRPALVVGLAVPVCYGITLSLDMAFGYTINRVTLFALILSLGLLVDDPITGVDNISRYLKKESTDARSRIAAAAAWRSAL